MNCLDRPKVFAVGTDLSTGEVIYYGVANTLIVGNRNMFRNIAVRAMIDNSPENLNIEYYSLDEEDELFSGAKYAKHLILQEPDKSRTIDRLESIVTTISMMEYEKLNILTDLHYNIETLIFIDLCNVDISPKLIKMINYIGVYGVKYNIHLVVHSDTSDNIMNIKSLFTINACTADDSVTYRRVLGYDMLTNCRSMNTLDSWVLDYRFRYTLRMLECRHISPVVFHDTIIGIGNIPDSVTDKLSSLTPDEVYELKTKGTSDVISKKNLDRTGYDTAFFTEWSLKLRNGDFTVNDIPVEAMLNELAEDFPNVGQEIVEMNLIALENLEPKEIKRIYVHSLLGISEEA